MINKNINNIFYLYSKMELQFETGSYTQRLILNDFEPKKSLVGLCTGWDMPELYENLNVDIIGNLYTKYGADVLIRNLFANPQIKLLIILNTNALGHNNIGNKGLNYIFSALLDTENSMIELHYDMTELFNGLIVYYVESTRIIIKTKWGIKIIEKQPTKVESLYFGDTNQETIQNILSLIDNDTLDLLTRKKIVYQPEKQDIVNYVPNEYVGKTIRGIDIFDAWFQTIQHVYKFGYKSKNLHEYHSVHWNYPINNMEEAIKTNQKIISQEDVQQLFGLDLDGLNDYAKTITENLVVKESAYTYGSRLEVYKERINSAINKDINTRYAFGTTLQYDKIDKQAPCLVYIQFLYDNVNSQMNLYAVFRSHDIFKAAFLNAYGLGKLLEKYCLIHNINFGRVEITSVSAHIYDSDLNNVKLLTDCLSTNMTDMIHYDPRGNCVITKNNNGYTCEIFEPKENKLINRLSGTNKDIYTKILQEQIITDTEHLLYIFSELFK